MESLENRQETKHTFSDFLYWNLTASVPFVTALVGLYRESVAWMILYLLAAIGCILLILRFFCSHCPHYTTGSKTLHCMFFWGIPKVFSENPGPPARTHKAIALAAPGILALLPVIALLQQIPLLVIYALSVGVFLLTVRRYACSRCDYTDCPVNRAPKGTGPQE
ncbi:MAG: hypothetical protein PVG49_11060 [Desulfobacteraceae bacterium]|jgi:hypothetical protein